MEDVEDFTYKVNCFNGPIFHFREVTPKDFYFAQVLRQTERSQLELIERLLINSEEQEKEMKKSARKKK